MGQNCSLFAKDPPSMFSRSFLLSDGLSVSISLIFDGIGSFEPTEGAGLLLKQRFIRQKEFFIAKINTQL